MTTLFIIIDKNFGFFYPHLHINCVAFAYKIIDTAGRKKTKLLPIKFIDTCNSVPYPGTF